MEQTQPRVPHVVLLPFPSLGHIKPMLSLAELLSHASFQVTFLNPQQIHDRLLLSMDMPAFHRRHPEFEFLSMPDPVRPSRDRPPPGLFSLHDKILSLGSVIKPALGELLISFNQEKGRRQPATCIIADGLLSSPVIDVSEQFEIPFFPLRTLSACCIWAYFNLPKLVEEGDVPFQVADEDMDKLVTCIPGLENVVRRRDLPGIFRIKRANDPALESFINDQTLVLPRASGLILNTFDELEAPVIAKLGSHFTKVYTVGPLHGLSTVRINDLIPLASGENILWKEDTSCMTWLDSQLSNSVIFVSFGSVIILTRDQMFELWHGLVNCGKPFLWVIREDSVIGEDGPSLILGKLKDMTGDKGLLVSWAPQEQVLTHPAIGGFLTHSGWNSTLESIFAGVPMICWPAIGDQQMNSRFVSDVWKIGFDMKDSCDRSLIEKLVRDLMEDKREEIMKSVNEIKKLAHEAVKEGGSSFCNLDKLIDDIRLRSHLAHNNSEGKK
ncbi:7-deoxyloganetic acid glucosyltransferase-like [Herrania umbratica]|uniref:Glycosyltransferase n=1 Tax=Herrania umbratica TaxID=108875 RepID=A0A6J1AST5_9ROSI|nr:7-deoxyloganetic acid glucosyltransferase-like [Herrania umbratica]XP_021289555.1 7-deoxyloganetic acid glucosyltransferase-like [Herrania umbratica]XP_021289556.1 7-deoxyloganetic acid glucosyltransferase-like [Herrania umbratica]